MARLLLCSLSLIAFALPARGQSTLPLVLDAEPGPLREQCGVLARVLSGHVPPQTYIELKRLAQADPKEWPDLAKAVQKLLDPLCLVGVHINPESRVKAVRGPLPAELMQGQDRLVLLRVHNEAGVTHPLTVSGAQLRGPKPERGQWLEAAVVGEKPLRKGLGGQKLEYVVLRLKAHEAGKREATLKFDVGQGTQDLGFRAEVPVLFAVKE